MLHDWGIAYVHTYSAENMENKYILWKRPSGFFLGSPRVSLSVTTLFQEVQGLSSSTMMVLCDRCLLDPHNMQRYCAIYSFTLVLLISWLNLQPAMALTFVLLPCYQ